MSQVAEMQETDRLLRIGSATGFERPQRLAVLRSQSPAGWRMEAREMRFGDTLRYPHKIKTRGSVIAWEHVLLLNVPAQWTTEGFSKTIAQHRDEPVFEKMGLG